MTDEPPFDPLGLLQALAGAGVEFVGDLVVQVASLDDLVRMKRAAARPKDLIEVEILEAIKHERR